MIDDYGHHPTEIAAVLAAVRSMFERRVVVVFQPHRYSRTSQLLDDFGPALREADEILLTDIYAAGEEPIAGISVDTLADAVRSGSQRPTRVVHSLDEVVADLTESARRGDVVLTLGAGSIGTLPGRLTGRVQTAGGTSLMPVAAPADKRFRRAHVSPRRRALHRSSWVDEGCDQRRRHRGSTGLVGVRR